MLEDFRKQVKAQIGENQLLRAISTLEAYLRQESTSFNGVLLLKARYNLNESQRRKNLVSVSDASVEFSRIADGLLTLVDTIEKSELLPAGELSQDYDEDWGLPEYLSEYVSAQKEYMICLEKVKFSQNKFQNDLTKAKDKIDALQNQTNNKVNFGPTGLQNVTMEMARDIHTFIDAFSEEIKKFDTLTNRTTYASFKIIEFMVEYTKKVDVKVLKKTIRQVKEMAGTMRSLEASFKKNKSVYERKFAFGKELNAASRRAATQHEMFIKKTRKCILILDIHSENLSILAAEYILNNSFIVRLLSFFGYKRNIQIRKYRRYSDFG